MKKEEYLSPKELSERLNISMATLGQHRFYNRGVPYIKVGKLVRYPLSEVIAYEKRLTVPERD